jgi:hypothetical protein
VAPPPLLGAQPPGTTCPRRAARAAYRAEPASAEPDLLCVAAGQPSAAGRIPAAFRTSSRSPRSPLSVPLLTRAPRRPERRRFGCLDRTGPKKEEDRFAFKPLENHVIFVLSYVSCTFYGKPPRLIPPFAHKSHPTLL